MSGGSRDIATHDGERLFLPMFSLTQTAYRLIVCRITDEMKSAQSLESADLTFQDCRRKIRNHVAGAENASGLVEQLKLRAAPRTCDWLGMKSAIVWVFV